MAQTDRSENVFRFQELARIIDATLANVSVGVSVGNNTMRIITFLADFPGMKEYVGEDFYNFIPRAIESNRAIRNEDGTINMRGPVKKILMYPLTTYPEWKVHKVPNKCDCVKGEIGRILSKQRFYLKIANGPLCAVLNGENFDQHIYRILADKHGRYDEKDYEPQDSLNLQCHISIVPSNIVAEIGESKVAAFVEDYVDSHDEMFGVEFVDLKSTFSEDWSGFSDVLVMGVRSDYIDRFMKDFNIKFERRVNPSLHISIASVRRDLFPDMENPHKKD